MSTTEPCPKRDHKMSKCQSCALNLPLICCPQMRREALMALLHLHLSHLLLPWWLLWFSNLLPLSNHSQQPVLLPNLLSWWLVQRPMMRGAASLTSDTRWVHWQMMKFSVCLFICLWHPFFSSKRIGWINGHLMCISTSRCHLPLPSRMALLHMSSHALHKCFHILNDRILVLYLHSTIAILWLESQGLAMMRVLGISDIMSNSTQNTPKFAQICLECVGESIVLVTNSNCLFLFVEDWDLLDIFANLNLNCVTLSHHTVSRNIKEIFYISRKEVRVFFQVS